MGVVRCVSTFWLWQRSQVAVPASSSRDVTTLPGHQPGDCKRSSVAIGVSTGTPGFALWRADFPEADRPRREAAAFSGLAACPRPNATREQPPITNAQNFLPIVAALLPFCHAGRAEPIAPRCRRQRKFSSSMMWLASLPGTSNTTSLPSAAAPSQNGVCSSRATGAVVRLEKSKKNSVAAP